MFGGLLIMGIIMSTKLTASQKAGLIHIKVERNIPENIFLILTVDTAKQFMKDFSDAIDDAVLANAVATIVKKSIENKKSNRSK